MVETQSVPLCVSSFHTMGLGFLSYRNNEPPFFFSMNDSHGKDAKDNCPHLLGRHRPFLEGRQAGQ